MNFSRSLQVQGLTGCGPQSRAGHWRNLEREIDSRVQSIASRLLALLIDNLRQPLDKWQPDSRQRRRVRVLPLSPTEYFNAQYHLLAIA